jgi:hypothetical protein
MSDNKYGRLYTEADLIAFAHHCTQEWAGMDRGMSEDRVRKELADFKEFKFPDDEPLFLLRARDKRALAAIRFYMDHQSPRAPVNHMDGIELAFRDFDHFAINNPERMREPD